MAPAAPCSLRWTRDPSSQCVDHRPSAHGRVLATAQMPGNPDPPLGRRARPRESPARLTRRWPPTASQRSWTPWPRARSGSAGPAAPPHAIRLCAGDTGSSWILGPGEPVATMDATAATLLLVLWGRLPADDPAVTSSRRPAAKPPRSPSPAPSRCPRRASRHSGPGRVLELRPPGTVAALRLTTSPAPTPSSSGSSPPTTPSPLSAPASLRRRRRTPCPPICYDRLAHHPGQSARRRNPG